jgi:hypothetical protein
MSEPSDPSTPPTPTTPLILPSSVSAVPISLSSTPTNPTGYEEITESILHPHHREPHAGTDSYNDGQSSQGLSHRSWSSISGDLMDESELARRRAERRRVRRHRLEVLNAQGELPETLKIEQTRRTPERVEVKEGGIPGLSADDGKPLLLPPLVLKLHL